MLEPGDLSAVVREAASGDPWYGSSTATLLEDLSADEAAAHPVPGAHSIAEIVHHLTGWMLEVERRLAGDAPQLPVDGDWPVDAQSSPVEWKELIERWRAANDVLAVRIARFAPDRWSAEVGGLREAALGTGVTYGAMIAGVIQHNAYHAGQIAMLRKALRERA